MKVLMIVQMEDLAIEVDFKRPAATAGLLS